MTQLPPMIEGRWRPRSSVAFHPWTADGQPPDSTEPHVHLIVCDDGAFAVRLPPGRYRVVLDFEDERTLEVHPELGRFEWGPVRPVHATPQERLPGFGIAAHDPVWPGGAERWMLDLCTLTDPPCMGVAFTEPPHPTQGGQMLIDRLRTMGIPVTVGLAGLRHLATTVPVLVDWRCTALPAALPRLRARRPRIIRVSHSPPEDAHAPAAHARAAREGYVDEWVAVSASAAKSVPHGTPYSIIHNAVPSYIAPATNSLRGRIARSLPRDSPVALYLGRLSPEKRPTFMLDLARALPEHWSILVGGLGVEYEAMAVAAMREDALRGRLILPGPVDTAEALDLAMALIVPSRYESFGYVIAEAWAAGVPVAAPPVGIAADRPDLISYPLSQPPDARLLAQALEQNLRAGHWPEAVHQARAYTRSELGMSAFLEAWSRILKKQVAAV